MSVEKRVNADGTRAWRVRWREAGRNRVRTFRTRRDADLFESDLIRRRRLGTLASMDSGTVTLDAFITDTWAPQRAVDFKPATRGFYAGLYRAHIAQTFASTPLREISPQRVAAWQAERVKAGGGRKAIREALSLLGSILGYAVELEHLQVNAARAVRPIRRPARKGVQPLSPATVEQIRGTLARPMPLAIAETQRSSGRRSAYEQADTRTPQTRQRDAALVSVLAYAGLRPGEALALTWRDVRDATLLVEHAADGTGQRKGTKTERGRPVRLLEPLAHDLRTWRLAAGRPVDGALIFPRSDGGMWTKTDWDNWRDRTWRKACRRVGLQPPRPYDLRHSFASLLLAEGRAIHYVAEQLGHGAEQTLRTYGHVIAEYRDRQALDAAVEIRAARDLAYPSRTPGALSEQAESGA